MQLVMKPEPETKKTAAESRGRGLHLAAKAGGRGSGGSRDDGTRQLLRSGGGTILAGLLAELFPAYEADQNVPVLNAALLALLAAGVVALFPSSARLQRSIERNQPVRAVEYLRTHPAPGPMFNDDFWGGYLIWASRGQQKVFIDGRSDAYEPSGVLADYLKIIQPAPDALALLEKYGVRSSLVERRGSLAALLDAQPSWGRIYQDDLCVLFVRKER